MNISYAWEGEHFDFECFDTELSPLLSGVILAGETYPRLEEVTDVEVVLDVGANVGASTVWFSRLYPDAAVHAFEPGRDAFGLLERNTADLANVRRHRFGLWSEDRRMRLYAGQEDATTASVVPNAETTERTEPVEMRSIRGWLEEVGISRIDVLKIDTEGCEVPILRSLGPRLLDTQVVYVEYHSEADRREIDAMLAASHVLAKGRVLHVHRGELAYVARRTFGSEQELRRDEIRPGAVPGQP